MKVNDLENKAEKLAKDLMNGLSGMKDFVDAGLASAVKLENELFASMTVKERAKHNAFIVKYEDLKTKGQLKEAEELKEKYTNE